MARWTKAKAAAIRAALRHNSLINEWNSLLNESQQNLEREIGTDAVNELIAGFTDEMRSDPALWDALCMQDDPYRWVYERKRPTH